MVAMIVIHEKQQLLRLLWKVLQLQLYQVNKWQMNYTSFYVTSFSAFAGVNKNKERV